MFGFGNVCYVDNPSWDVLLGFLLSNNQSDLKVQKTLKMLDESNFY
jgi:hypothetical protein